jgi:3-oxoadipate enol-lactonase
MGGMIAQELALRHAKRVKHLVLGCTTCGGPQAIMASLEVMAQLFVPPDLPREEAVRRQWQVIFSAAFLAQQNGFLDRMTARALAYPTPLHTAIRQAMAIQRFNTYGRLGQIMTPTLVVTGDADIVVPPVNSRLLANKVPGAMFELFNGAGHGFFWEASKGVIDLLCDFCYVFGRDDSAEIPTGHVIPPGP